MNDEPIVVVIHRFYFGDQEKNLNTQENTMDNYSDYGAYSGGNNFSYATAQPITTGSTAHEDWARYFSQNPKYLAAVICLFVFTIIWGFISGAICLTAASQSSFCDTDHSKNAAIAVGVVEVVLTLVYSILGGLLYVSINKFRYGTISPATLKGPPPLEQFQTFNTMAGYQ